jgi:hypothetical protein
MTGPAAVRVSGRRTTRSAVGGARGGWRDRICRAVFPTRATGRLTLRAVLVTVGAVVAGTAVCLARVPGNGPFDSIWAEDGYPFYNDALNGHAIYNLFVGHNGYFLVLSRLIAEGVALAPVSWAAAMLSTCAAMFTAILAGLVYVASGAHLRSGPLRLLVAVPVLACPTGTLSTMNNVATLQFVAVYAAFWVLLWTPASRFGRLFALSFLVLTGLTTVLTVALVPLALLRVYALRDRYALLLSGSVIAPVAFQAYGLVAGINSRSGISRPRFDPVWAVLEYVHFAVPNSILGQLWLLPPTAQSRGYWVAPATTANPVVHVVLLVCAYLVVLVAVALAVRRFTRPAWGLVAAAGLSSVFMFGVEAMSFGYSYAGTGYLKSEAALLMADRYLVPVTLLIIATMTALLAPRPVEATGRTAADAPQPVEATGRAAAGGEPGAERAPRVDRRRLLHRAPVVGYAVLVLLIMVANLRPPGGPRQEVPSWSTELATARTTCQTTNAWSAPVYFGRPGWPWPVTVPCRRLR